jgi:hypothetical protein
METYHFMIQQGKFSLDLRVNNSINLSSQFPRVYTFYRLWPAIASALSLAPVVKARSCPRRVVAEPSLSSLLNRRCRCQVVESVVESSLSSRDRRC